LSVINAKPATSVSILRSNIRVYFRLEESATLFMLAGLDGAIALSGNFHAAKAVFSLNLAIMVLIFLVSWAHHRFQQSWVLFLRDWVLLPVLIVVYLQLGSVIPLVRPEDMDPLLIAVDRKLFCGHDPTILLEPFLIPAFTEILQIVYASFYLLPLSLCVIAYLQRKREVFHTSVPVILIGFYISYIGYFVAPAIGPRYTLAHLQSVELSGLWSFHYIRAMLDHASGVMRDCFPSGHTMLSILTILLASRYEKKFAPIALIWGLMLIFSTVYLRYHYVIDVIAGLTLALAFWGIFPLIERWQLGFRSH